MGELIEKDGVGSGSMLESRSKTAEGDLDFVTWSTAGRPRFMPFRTGSVDSMIAAMEANHHI
ncbi:MAG: hypothetical protein OXB98_03885 [Bryobacterales bacterium]|nr:hypothetical protein [Bryobacterales bacterium]